MLRHQADGQKIERFRDARGWTQEQLALVAGYSVKTIWKAEASRELKRQTLVDIAQALGVGLDEIVVDPLSVGPTKAESVNKDRIVESLGAVLHQNLAQAMDLVHRDALFESPAPPPFPYGGMFHGRREVRNFFVRSFATAPLDTVELERLVAEGPFVDLHMRVTHESPRTRKTITYNVCYHFRIADGRIIQMREYQDYAALATFFDENGWPHWRK